ncbi:N-acylneuraminate cytidylyltransferase [Gelidibacter algens]|uniref:N-acylneuraminate cytidylyltransferase n=1 Tax=Gelidibacter algens TaxID=49280 RepID=A0A1A7QQL4_9FLAO|nr:acylneuraminate cytidylyltransferase family protein [Gelidibacter algens]OBX21489.1 acylneuraminate cytidylyltransferase [Gelidibacter algens]RAJ25222.1 N-acylneuraminate cytidylyltransferase [Gelidibacter algens]
MKNNLTIAIVPARGGSKRLPSKNTIIVGGLPLLVHSILYAQAQPEIDAVYVSTNDAHIKKIALDYGALVIDRPDSLSGDFEPTLSALQHVLETIKDSVEDIVLLQPTNPLRPKTLFKEAFTIFKAQDLNSLFTVSRNHDKLGVIKNNVFLPFNYKPGQRSQDLEPLYYENGLLYITKASAIRAGHILTADAFPLEVTHPFAEIDIDTQEDLNYAEYLFDRFSLGE